MLNRVIFLLQIASTFALLLAVLCIIICYGVIEAWFGGCKRGNCGVKLFACLRSWLILPLFIFLVIMAWVFSMVFIIGSTASADMCVDSPDTRLEEVLIKYGDFSEGDLGTESIILRFLLFYIRGCPVDASPERFVEKITEVLGVLDTAVGFVTTIAGDPTIEQVCGSDAAALVSGTASTSFATSVCSLAEALVRVQLFFSCENWRPLYRAIMYDSVCYNGNEGFYYVAITQFCIVMFAMIMLTLRVAFTEVELNDDDESNTGLNAAAVAMASAPPAVERTNGASGSDDKTEWTTRFSDHPEPQY